MAATTESATANAAQKDNINEVIDHIGAGFTSIFKGIIHGIIFLTPFAKVAATAAGAPDAALGADVANATAQEAEVLLEQQDAQKTKQSTGAVT